MNPNDKTRWPGDAAIAQKKRTSPWNYLFFSLATGFLAAGFVALLFFAPAGMSVRLPWLVVALLNLIGPIGVIGLLGLASLTSLVLGIRAFFRRS